MTNKIVKKLWNHVPKIKQPVPDGWLTIAEFCDRAGNMKVQRIYKAIEFGRIPKKHMAITKAKNRQDIVVIDWDAAAYDYIAAGKQAFRPPDFKINDAREYKPFRRSAQQKIAVEKDEVRREEIVAEITGATPGKNIDSKLQDIVDERLVNDKMVITQVMDVTTARYRKEQLEIEKRQIELRKESNELITFDTERSMLAGIAAQINGNASKSIPKWSPIFAAEEDPRVIRQLMKQMYVDILTPMEVEDE